MLTPKTILGHPAFSALSEKLFSGIEIEVLERPQSLIVKKKEEEKDVVIRIIALKASGCSSNNLSELSSHNEVRKAKIVVKGNLLEDKKGFSLKKGSLEFAYLTTREAITEPSIPYAQVSDNLRIYREKIFSAKDEVYVVKENGEGFYHNLINLTDEWLVLVLTKELRSGKDMDVERQLKDLPVSEKKLITELFNRIHVEGDDLFHSDLKFVKKILEIESKKLVPVLIEGLNIYETGRHEPCTVFALLLNKGKMDKKNVLKYLAQALLENSAPAYYLNELIEKINKK